MHYHPQMVAHVGEYVSRLLDERGMSARSLMKVLGVNQSSVSRKLTGSIRITAQDIHKLAEHFGMTVKEFEEGWKSLRPAQSSGIPVINRAPAGEVVDYNHDQGALAERHDAWQYIDRGMIGAEDAYAVVVVGDSMEPTMREGDMCVFLPMMEDHPKRQPVPRQVVFVRYTEDAPRRGCCLCRWQSMEDGQWLLTKDNPKYPPVVVKPEHVARMGLAIERRSRSF